MTYLGSQPWPFPSSLMLGFSARAGRPRSTADDDEIDEARWFSRDELRADDRRRPGALSPSISIARRLIEHWYGEPLPRNAEG